MRITSLKDRGRFRIRVSPTEMAALNKLMEMGLLALEQHDADEDYTLTTSERKAIAYWNGNPFRGLPPKKPRRRPRKPAKPPEVQTPVPKPKAAPVPA